MMKLNIIKTIMVALIMVVFTMVTCVYAADNNPNGYTCNITLTPDKTSVKPGEDITYELTVSDINAGNGLKMVEFYVGNYDSNTFECKVRNYNEDKWSLINNEGYITIASTDSEAWTTNEKIAKIIYTPKSGVSNNTYQAGISNISVTTDDSSKISLEDLTLNIKVESEQIIDNNYSCNLTFTPDKTSVKPGESITYNLEVSNINAGNGLKMLEFYVGNYDTSKFECKVNNYNENKWSIRNTEGYISISSNNSEAWKTDEILAKLIYMPKSGVTANTYQAKIINIKATTDDNNVITLNDTTLNIKVDAEQQTVDKNYSCSITVTPDKTSVISGEDLTYDLKVSNINAGNGLKNIEFYLENYDPNVFDCKIINYDESKWTISNSGGNIVITSKNSQPWTNEEILAKIIYTPKSDTIANTYQTKITNISATTDDNTKLTMEDINLNIKVELSNNASSEDNPSNQNASSDENNKTSESTTQNTDEKSNSKNSMILPYTGKLGIFTGILSIVIFISASTLFYIKYKKYNI